MKNEIIATIRRIVAVIVFLFVLGLNMSYSDDSLFDNGAVTKKIDSGNTPVKLAPLAPPISIEVYSNDKVMKSVTVDPLKSVGFIRVGERFVATAFPLQAHDYTYLVTCAHVVRGIEPKEEITFTNGYKTYQKCMIAALDKTNDICVLVAEGLDNGLTLSNEGVKVGSQLHTLGADKETKSIVETKHTVKGAEKDAYYTDGPGYPGRSGSPTLDKDNEVIGIFCGFVKPEAQFYKGLMTQTKTENLLTLLDLKQYKVTFYSGAVCRFCRQAHEITDNVNDRRVIADWTLDDIPKWILKELPKGYMLPVPVWKCTTGKDTYSWPQKSGVHSIDDLVHMCEKSGAVSESFNNR